MLPPVKDNSLGLIDDRIRRMSSVYTGLGQRANQGYIAMMHLPPNCILSVNVLAVSLSS